MTYLGCYTESMNKIHLTKYGRGYPLVFFHGWGFDSSVWRHLQPFLAHDFELIFVDLPGFGASANSGWCDFKEELLLILPRHFALVGWSLGGLFATRLAIEEPQRVEYLYNITSSPCFLAKESWPGVQPDVFQGFFNNLSLNPKETLENFVRLQAQSNTFEVNEKYLPSPEALWEGLNILKSWDFREHLHQMSQPVCYLFGRLDPITPVQVMETMREAYPDFRYVLFRKSAHMPFMSHPIEFVKELKEFIQ